MHAVCDRIDRWWPLLLLTAGAIAGGCGSEPAPAPPLPPPQVTVALPIRRDVIEYQEFTGRMAAFEVVNIRARVSGLLEAVHFREGGVVRRGAMLYSIEQAPYVAARNVAVAEVRTVEADLARARSDLARLDQALRTNAVSAQDVDRARAEVTRLEANLLGRQARLDQAELELSYTEIRAPIGGLVGRNLLGAGNFVSGPDIGSLVTIMRIDPMYAYFDASEMLVLELLGAEGLALGDEPPAAWLGLADEAGWPHAGRLDYVDNTVDPDTGTIRAGAVFPNPTGKLFPGLFARIRVPGPVLADAVLVAERAVGTDLGGKYVLVVGDGDVVELRHIEVGALEGGLRVVAAGLRADERYVVNGIQRARPGLPVTPVMREAPAVPSGASAPDEASRLP